MKRTTLIILFFAACFSLQAQDLDHKHMDFGIKAGLNVANISTSNSPFDYDPRLGLNLGLLLHIHFAKMWAVQPELYFSAQGGKFDSPTLDKGTTELNYLNVPILVQYMFGNGFRLETGPQVGFLVSAEHDYDNGEDVDINENINDLDFSWAIGASYLMPSGFGVNARYNIGLTNINESQGVTFTNSVFQLGIFYHFNTVH